MDHQLKMHYLSTSTNLQGITLEVSGSILCELPKTKMLYENCRPIPWKECTTKTVDSSYQTNWYENYTVLLVESGSNRITTYNRFRSRIPD